CVRHAASVHPEPGSNSQFKKFNLKLKNIKRIAGLLNFFCLIFKDLICLCCFVSDNFYIISSIKI
ncbi:MAG: hypothetical protein ACRC6T_16240, partial [Sarcina sp.]